MRDLVWPMLHFFAPLLALAAMISVAIKLEEAFERLLMPDWVRWTVGLGTVALIYYSVAVISGRPDMLGGDY